MLFHYNNGYTNEQKFYVIRTLTVLLSLDYLHCIVIFGKGEEESERKRREKEYSHPDQDESPLNT